MKIHRIETGKVRIKTNQISKPGGLGPQMLQVLFGKEWSEWLPIYAWAIEHNEGIIVVDTGETYKTGIPGYLPRWHPYYSLAVQFDVKPKDEIGPKLLEIGIDPARDVKKVIMTHMHTDHAGGLYHFPNSEILIEKNEYEAASGLTGKIAGYLPHRWPTWLEPTLVSIPYNPYYSFSHSLAVTLDQKVMVVSTPGHVANHISVIAEIEGIHYFIAGDTSYTQENLLNLIPDGVGTDQSLHTLQNVLSFSESLPTIYLPSHDPSVPQRMAYKEIVKINRKSVTM